MIKEISIVDVSPQDVSSARVIAKFLSSLPRVSRLLAVRVWNREIKKVDMPTPVIVRGISVLLKLRRGKEGADRHFQEISPPIGALTTMLLYGSEFGGRPITAALRSPDIED